jgi:uncharacterized protein YutE (UPF0331/DUF86 family)
MNRQAIIETLQARVPKLLAIYGFRNIAVHDYQTLQLPITVSIITTHLDEFLQYGQAVLLRDAASHTGT